jgi:hypothetical protein
LGQKTVKLRPSKCIPVCASKQKDYIDGQVHYERDLVVGGDGALYQAQCDTAQSPPHADWHCVTRAGRDGKDAVWPSRRLRKP